MWADWGSHSGCGAAAADYLKNQILEIAWGDTGNPSGLRRIDRSQVEFSHQSWYQDVGIENLQVVFPGSRFSFGFGATYLNYGTVQSYDEYGDPGEDLSMYSLAFTVSAATDITDNLAMGISGKYIEQSFDVQNLILSGIDLIEGQGEVRQTCIS